MAGAHAVATYVQNGEAQHAAEYGEHEEHGESDPARQSTSLRALPDPLVTRRGAFGHRKNACTIDGMRQSGIDHLSIAFCLTMYARSLSPPPT